MSANNFDGDNPRHWLESDSEYAEQSYGDDHTFRLEETEADENVRYDKIINELTEFENAQTLSALESRRLSEH